MKFKLAVYLRLLRYFYHTVRFNFAYFPFGTAVKLPIVFYCRPRLLSLEGSIELKTPPRFRMIGLGYPGNAMKSRRGEVFWDNRGGTVVFNGAMGANPGFSVRVLAGAHLEFGQQVSFGQQNLICCKERIVFGNGVLSSWDNQFFDNDFHLFYDVDANQIIPASQPVQIGGKVFIGARSTILKGTVVSYRSVVASNSTLTKHYGDESCCLIAGNPASVQRKRVTLILSEPPLPSELEELQSL